MYNHITFLGVILEFKQQNKNKYTNLKALFPNLKDIYLGTDASSYKDEVNSRCLNTYCCYLLDYSFPFSLLVFHADNAPQTLPFHHVLEGFIDFRERDAMGYKLL